MFFGDNVLDLQSCKWRMDLREKTVLAFFPSTITHKLACFTAH